MPIEIQAYYLEVRTMFTKVIYAHIFLMKKLLYITHDEINGTYPDQYNHGVCLLRDGHPRNQIGTGEAERTMSTVDSLICRETERRGEWEGEVADIWSASGPDGGLDVRVDMFESGHVVTCVKELHVAQTVARIDIEDPETYVQTGQISMQLYYTFSEVARRHGPSGGKIIAESFFDQKFRNEGIRQHYLVFNCMTEF
ncbi:hypothetical protein C8R44DRAFT_738625 [Mycena epipterygia]|nr:hypothetical protein C8R44DRAFT_738625 [Mycena epipterygia]